MSNLMKNELDSVSVHGDEYIKTEIKSYVDTINTNFEGEKIRKENTQYTCLSVILDSVFKVGKKYYRQTLLEECKYKTKKNKIKNLINDDLNLSSSDDNESDDEPDNEPNDESDDKSDDQPDDESSNEKNENQQKFFNY